MQNKSAVLLLICLLSIFSIAFTGCWKTGELTESTVQIELEEVETVEAKVVIYKGNLHITGVQQLQLLNSKFSSNLEKWNPQVIYSTEGHKGKLKILQTDKQKNISATIESDWFLFFNNMIPLELDLIVGNGDNQLDFSEINLTSLKVAIGTGDSTINLTGNYRDDLIVHLMGGIGNTIIDLPKDTGVCLLIEGFINKINCNDFYRIGSFYYNSSFDFAKKNIFITIFSGLGKININLV